VIAARCLRDAGSADVAAVLAAARALDTTTLFGRFRLDPATGAQVGHQVVTVQWQDGLRVAVWPPERATAAVRLR
jgi:branched-chain amino acid transport system substrate-binding protein